MFDPPKKHSPLGNGAPENSLPSQSPASIPYSSSCPSLQARLPTPSDYESSYSSPGPYYTQPLVAFPPTHQTSLYLPQQLQRWQEHGDEHRPQKLPSPEQVGRKQYLDKHDLPSPETLHHLDKQPSDLVTCPTPHQESEYTNLQKKPMKERIPNQLEVPVPEIYDPVPTNNRNNCEQRKENKQLQTQPIPRPFSEEYPPGHEPPRCACCSIL
ncbi:early nodulin-75-like [Herrania umbratica]|uniref:Early nodulin-75-like n=1 Tax=Herrania umbratica TaxID=108875 RepID=A0A6J1BA91_9ROSI|nr:early nodulin-75-like [Herrania umbratica]